MKCVGIANAAAGVDTGNAVNRTSRITGKKRSLNMSKQNGKGPAGQGAGRGKGRCGGQQGQGQGRCGNPKQGRGPCAGQSGKGQGNIGSGRGQKTSSNHMIHKGD